MRWVDRGQKSEGELSRVIIARVVSNEASDLRIARGPFGVRRTVTSQSSEELAVLQGLTSKGPRVSRVAAARRVDLHCVLSS